MNIMGLFGKKKNLSAGTNVKSRKARSRSKRDKFVKLQRKKIRAKTNAQKNAINKKIAKL